MTSTHKLIFIGSFVWLMHWGNMSFHHSFWIRLFSKLCENVTSWFLNNFFPRHKIDVEIVHRDLKEEQVRGYCDVVGCGYRPRDFLIELDTYMTKELYIKTLFTN